MYRKTDIVAGIPNICLDDMMAAKNPFKRATISSVDCMCITFLRNSTVAKALMPNLSTIEKNATSNSSCWRGCVRSEKLH